MSDAAINQKKEDIKKSLTFEPNDFAKSLDILALEPAENGADYQVILAVVLALLACVIIAVAMVIIRRVRMKSFQKSITKK
jgi:drug/metabolite transporter (DMT)-like permease